MTFLLISLNSLNTSVFGCNVRFVFPLSCLTQKLNFFQASSLSVDILLRTAWGTRSRAVVRVSACDGQVLSPPERDRR